MSSKVRPARATAFLMASIGPAPIMRGSIPAAAADKIFAIGFKPYF